MNHLAFTWHETGSLSAQLAAGAVQATLVTMADFPHVLTLWHADGTGLQIRCTMHDVAERVEIGVLEFALVNKEKKDSRPSSNLISLINIDISASFHSHNKVTKLVISQSGTTAESGIIITASGGKEIVIVSGVMPYSLAIKGLFSTPRIFEPEYDLECYEKMEIA